MLTTLWFILVINLKKSGDLTEKLYIDLEGVPASSFFVMNYKDSSSGLQIEQIKYIKRILLDYEMEDCTPNKYPLNDKQLDL
jgi:hypothetical protein